MDDDLSPPDVAADQDINGDGEIIQINDENEVEEYVNAIEHVQQPENDNFPDEQLDDNIIVDGQENINIELPLVNDHAVPQLRHLRDRVLHFFNGRARHFRRGDVLRNWIIRRRARMDPDEDSDTSSSDEDGDLANDKQMKEFLKKITFDKNLPSAHSYLGEMEECSGVAYQDRNTFQSISLLHVYDFVLIPGQTLPLMFSRPNEIAMIRRIMTQPDKTFGVLTRRYYRLHEEEESVERSDLYSYGCTAEIRSFQDKEEYEVSSISVVVVGRQKFKVMESRRQIDGNFLAKVEILEDADLPDMISSIGHAKYAGAFRLRSNSLLDRHKAKWAATRHSAFSTGWPPWVYKMYDVDYLRMQIFSEMREWNQQLEEKHCPQGASDFSFWVITNLPVSDKRKLQLLRMNSAVQRLRFELHLFQKCTLLNCTNCNRLIANRNDVFSMSVSGPMAAYVNPGGVVHETLTLYKASGLTLIGRKSTEHSWFPGYAWTICQCRHCGRHMGWKFSATKSDMNPQKFWGLTRSALSPRVSTGDDTDALLSSDGESSRTSNDDSDWLML